MKKFNKRFLFIFTVFFSDNYFRNSKENQQRRCKQTGWVSAERWGNSILGFLQINISDSPKTIAILKVENNENIMTTFDVILCKSERLVCDWPACPQCVISCVCLSVGEEWAGHCSGSRPETTREYSVSQYQLCSQCQWPVSVVSCYCCQVWGMCWHWGHSIVECTNVFSVSNHMSWVMWSLS